MESILPSLISGAVTYFMGGGGSSGGGGTAANYTDPRMIDLATRQQQIAEDIYKWYKDTYRPAEQIWVDEAIASGSIPAQEYQAGKAHGDITQAFTNARDQNTRRLQSMGITPNSGRMVEGARRMDTGQAMADAGAMTTARERERDRGWARLSDVVSVGRGLPGVSSAALAGSANTLNAANSMAARNFQMDNANAYNAGAFMGPLTSGITNAILPSINNWMTTNRNESRAWDDARATMPPGAMGDDPYGYDSYAKGGKVKPKSLPSPDGRKLFEMESGGYVLNKKTADVLPIGKKIKGPGTGTSDSIPASIDGAPAALVSNGERYVPPEQVKNFGEDFLKWANENPDKVAPFKDGGKVDANSMKCSICGSQFASHASLGGHMTAAHNAKAMARGGKVEKVMREFKHGTLHSGKKGPVVKNRKQAIAIALSEARDAGKKLAAGGPVDLPSPAVYDQYAKGGKVCGVKRVGGSRPDFRVARGQTQALTLLADGGKVTPPPMGARNRGNRDALIAAGEEVEREEELRDGKFEAQEPIEKKKSIYDMIMERVRGKKMKAGGPLLPMRKVG